MWHVCVCVCVFFCVQFRKDQCRLSSTVKASALFPIHRRDRRRRVWSARYQWPSQSWTSKMIIRNAKAFSSMINLRPQLMNKFAAIYSLSRAPRVFPITTDPVSYAAYATYATVSCHNLLSVPELWDRSRRLWIAQQWATLSFGRSKLCKHYNIIIIHTLYVVYILYIP